MRHQQPSAIISSKGSLTFNKVLRKTYSLLAITLLFSAVMAIYAMRSNAMVSPILLLVGMFGLYFLTMATRNSKWGLLSILLFTGFMGYTLGPVLNLYIKNYANGMELISMALGSTGVIFVVLSGYVLITKKNFNYLGGIISVALIAVILGSFAAMFFHMPIFQLILSGAIAVIMSAFILYQTSLIINGGETNYIMATITLYLSIFNLFITLLQIFGAFGGSRD